MGKTTKNELQTIILILVGLVLFSGAIISLMTAIVFDFVSKMWQPIVVVLVIIVIVIWTVYNEGGFRWGGERGI